MSDSDDENYEEDDDYGDDFEDDSPSPRHQGGHQGGKQGGYQGAKGRKLKHGLTKDSIRPPTPPTNPRSGSKHHQRTKLKTTIGTADRQKERDDKLTKMIVLEQASHALSNAIKKAAKPVQRYHKQIDYHACIVFTYSTLTIFGNLISSKF
jgi:hypothetical protein